MSERGVTEEPKALSSQDSAVIDPVLPAPVPPRGRMPFFKFLRTLPDNTIATFAQEAYEQDIVERKLFGRHMFIINDPAAIKQVLIDNVANYEKTEIVRRVLEPGLGKGLITLEGETWRRHRRTMAPAFDHRSIAAFTPVMTEAAEELLGAWNQLGAGACTDVAEDMMEVTLKIISRTMFSSDSDDIMTVMSGAAGRYQAEIRPNILDLLGFPLWLAAFGRKNAADLVFDEFDTVIDRLIETRARDPANGPKDLLGRLIAARDEQTGGGMSAQEVRDHVITIFMAGHETTAMAMTWAWFLLSQHPAVEAKLYAELDSVLGGRSPSQEDLAKLTYTRMVIEETMRIYPTVPAMEREAMADDTLAGRRIPKGSTVMIVPWVLHRHEKLWPNPGRFDPERFSAEQSATRPRFIYLPFGGGRRICIGAAFSLAEATILLATLAQRYRLQLAPGHRVEPQGLITLRPRHGMKMLLNPR
jgi:cytochrome P450